MTLNESQNLSKPQFPSCFLAGELNEKKSYRAPSTQWQKRSPQITDAIIIVIVIVNVMKR